MSLGFRCHPRRVVRCELLTRLSIFSPPGPTYHCPFTEPFNGSKSTFGQSSGFTTDSPALESTVISRCRPRSPSVATGLQLMDMFANCDCVQVHLIKPPLSIIEVVVRSVFSFTGNVTQWRLNLQTLVHSQFMAHRTGQEVY